MTGLASFLQMGDVVIEAAKGDCHICHIHTVYLSYIWPLHMSVTHLRGEEDSWVTQTLYYATKTAV